MSSNATSLLWQAGGDHGSLHLWHEDLGEGHRIRSGSLAGRRLVHDRFENLVFFGPFGVTDTTVDDKCLQEPSGKIFLVLPLRLPQQVQLHAENDKGQVRTSHRRANAHCQVEVWYDVAVFQVSQPGIQNLKWVFMSTGTYASDHAHQVVPDGMEWWRTLQVTLGSQSGLCSLGSQGFRKASGLHEGQVCHTLDAWKNMLNTTKWPSSFKETCHSLCLKIIEEAPSS